MLVDDILVRTNNVPSTSRGVPEVVTLDDDEIIFEMQRNLESGGLEQKLRRQMAAESGGTAWRRDCTFDSVHGKS